MTTGGGGCVERLCIYSPTKRTPTTNDHCDVIDRSIVPGGKSTVKMCIGSTFNEKQVTAACKQMVGSVVLRDGSGGGETYTILKLKFACMCLQAALQVYCQLTGSQLDQCELSADAESKGVVSVPQNPRRAKSRISDDQISESLSRRRGQLKIFVP